MKKLVLPSMCFVLALTAMYCHGTALAEEAASPSQSQAAWQEFSRTAESLRQQLFEKRNALDTLYREEKPDEARAQTLVREIGELKAQMFAARSKFQAQAGDGACPGWGQGGFAGGSHRGYGPRGGMGGGYGGGYGVGPRGGPGGGFGARRGGGPGRHHGGW